MPVFGTYVNEPKLAEQYLTGESTSGVASVDFDATPAMRETMFTATINLLIRRGYWSTGPAYCM